jgi:hypothetical protein
MHLFVPPHSKTEAEFAGSLMMLVLLSGQRDHAQTEVASSAITEDSDLPTMLGQMDGTTMDRRRQINCGAHACIISAS